MITFNKDGSVTLLNDTTGATQKFPPGTPETVWVAAYAILQPPVAPPPVPAQIVVIPSINPGVTGALYLNSTTLQVSLGPNAAVQIGATGPTGPIGLTGAQVQVG